MLRKKHFKKWLAMLLSVFIFVTMFPDTYEGSHVKAAISSIYNANNNIAYNTHETNANDKDLNVGKIVVPETEGKYPVLFFVHGSGGEAGWNSTIARYADYWYRQGYIDPMVIVVPSIKNYQDTTWGTKDFKDYVKEGYLKKIVDALKSANVNTLMNTLGIEKVEDAEKLISRVDVNAPMSITGFSMGGACSLYAGCMMNEEFINVGGLSPASSFYNATVGGGNENWFMVTKARDLVYSKHEDAHLLMTYGEAEKDGSGNIGAFKENVTNFNTVIEANGQNKENCFTIKGFSLDYGGHQTKLFKREIFTFLYYVKNDELPSPEIIELACRTDTSQADYVENVGNNGIKGFVRISGTPKVGQTLTVSVEDSNATKLSYQWRRGRENISGATGATYKLTGADLGKKISCKVSDASGSFTGFVSGAIAGKVTDDSGSTTPTPVPSTPTPQPMITGKVTLSNQTPQYPNGIMATVSECNSLNPQFQWMRGDTAISGATQAYYAVQKDDIGHQLSCVVTDGNGKYGGSIRSAKTSNVLKASGPEPPKNLTVVNCTKGAKNGKILNVTAEMEYSVGTEAGPYVSCSGTEITGLAAGIYYVRYKETDCVLSGGKACVEIKEVDSDPSVTDVTSIFVDVPAGKWYVGAVQFVYDHQIMVGKGLDPNGSGKQIFDPNANLTRGEFATLLYNLDGKPDVTYLGTFTDVPERAYYAKPIQWMYNNNIAAGVGNGLFRPNENITREQIAMIMYSYTKYKGGVITADASLLDRFSDVGQISGWAKEAMAWAVTQKVINGTGEANPKLNPKQAALRCECAAIIKSYLEKQ